MAVPEKKEAVLYLVATPIGNLQDISFRAVEVLKNVGLVACEDTRHTRKLLSAFDIHVPLISCHEHNEDRRSPELIDKMREGISIALVSDAGTPAVNDPGFRLVRDAVAAGLDVVPIPGPAAFVSAVVGSGLPTDSIFFGGFLPSRSGERRRRLEEVRAIPATLVFYESPHRLAGSIADCLDVLGDRNAAVARELTKLHEEFIRGTLSEISQRIGSADVKGELVLVIDRGSTAADDTPQVSLAERVNRLQAEGMTNREAIKAAAKEFGLSRSEAYRRIVRDGVK